MLKMLPGLFVFLTLAISQDSSAEFLQTKEGFNQTTPAQNLQAAWDSTLFLQFVQEPVSMKSSEFSTTMESDMSAPFSAGTVSVIAAQKVEGVTYLGLITAKHVLKHAQFPKKFYKNLRMRNADEKPFIDSETPLLSVVDMATVQAEFEDLAFLVIKVPSAEAQGFKPLKPAKSCNLKTGETLALIGFPAVWERNMFYQRGLWTDPDTLTKRWSVGVYVGDQKKTEYGPVVGMTADAVSGNSGGPTLNARGELVGIMSAAIEGGFYFGNEKKGALESHSYFVDCSLTKAFAEKARTKFSEVIKGDI